MAPSQQVASLQRLAKFNSIIMGRH